MYMPPLTPLVDRAYAELATPGLGGHVIKFHHGVQQRDPLGPLLFSLVAHRGWTKVRQIGAAQGLGFAFFLPRRVHHGSPEVAAGHVGALVTELPMAGFELNPTKCSRTPSAGGDSGVGT